MLDIMLYKKYKTGIFFKEICLFESWLGVKSILICKFRNKNVETEKISGSLKDHAKCIYLLIFLLSVYSHAVFKKAFIVLKVCLLRFWRALQSHTAARRNINSRLSSLVIGKSIFISFKFYINSMI